MITLRHTVSALALSTLLVMGACKKNSGDAPDIDVKVKSADANLMKKLLEVDDRTVADVEADEALTAMGLKSKSPRLTWDSMSGSGGDYQYKNLTLKTDDGEDVKIAGLNFDGVHMSGDHATFDKMSISGVSISDDDVTGSIDSLTLSRPHPQVAAAILQGVGDLDSLEGLDFDLDNGEAFGALLLEGMKVKADDADVTIDTFGWGTDVATGKGTFLAKNISVIADDGGDKVNISLKTMSATDVSAEIMSAFKSGFNGEGMPSINPFQSGYGNMLLEDLNVSVEGFNLNLEGVEASSKTKGDIVTEKSVMKPLRIKFDGGDMLPYEMREAKEALDKMGYDELVFTATSKSVKNKSKDSLVVSDSNFTMVDGFKLNYDLKATGLEAISKAQTGMDAMDNPMGGMENLVIESMNISFTDDSILDRALTLAAEESGQSPALMKTQAQMGLMMLPAMAENKAQGKIMSDLADALGKFISDGGTLTMSVNPPTPIAVSTLENMGDGPEVIEKLGLSFGHKK